MHDWICQGRLDTEALIHGSIRIGRLWKVVLCNRAMFSGLITLLACYANCFVLCVDRASMEIDHAQSFQHKHVLS